MIVFFRVASLSFLLLCCIRGPAQAGDPAFQVHEEPPHGVSVPPEVPRISLGMSLGAETPDNDFGEGGPQWRDSWGVSLRLGTSGRSHLAFTGRFTDYYFRPLRWEGGRGEPEQADMHIYEFLYGGRFQNGLIDGSHLVLETGPALVRAFPGGGDYLEAAFSAHLGWLIPLGKHVDLEPRLSLLAMVLDKDQDWPMLAGAHLGIRLH